ncbi:DUF2857 domain-containing protein [Carnimonas bestiolae]|uniref:DUF2857 domain-containing protein n=1 Tax=Carnimonas bestiolae TaxID=3402172 RepID=UPI003EDBC71A
MTTAYINYALFSQVLKHINEGDLRRARSLGFSDEELQRLRQLSAWDINMLIHEFPNVARFEIDHVVLETSIRRLARNQTDDALISRCIKQGASVSMLSRFFGLTLNDIATRRTLLGLRSTQGRPPMPDEESEHAAWYRWQTICEDPSSPTASENLVAMLELAEESDLQLSIVYQLVRQWTDPEQSSASDNGREEPEFSHPQDGNGADELGKPDRRRGVA